MAVTLARGKGSNTENKLLELFTTDPTSVPSAHRLADATSVVFEVWRTFGTGDPPALVSASAAAVRIDLGYYVAEWTPDIDEEVARYEVRWTHVLDGVTYTSTTVFEVLSESARATKTGYVLVQDLRDEGLETYTDVILQNRILRATSLLERFTGRRFLPEFKTAQLDGNGGRMLLLDEAICALGLIEIDSSIYSSADLEIELDTVRVYNRHLTQNLTSPDDRENPKLEFYSGEGYDGLRWARGAQNTRITGVFGYTEGPGIPGSTPILVQQIVQLLVMRDLFPLSDVDGRAELSARIRITKERTRDQEVNYSPASEAGAQGIGRFTGDPYIDTLVAMLCRPPTLGSA